MAAARLLDDAETRRLARMVRAGGPAAQPARARLAEANMGLVVALAQPFRRRGLPLADLIGHGSIGLVRAIDGFDPERGARFSTYAGWWIRAYIHRGLARAHPVSVPEWAREAIRAGRADGRQGCIGAAVAALRMARISGESAYPMQLWLIDDRPDPRAAAEDADDLHAALATLPDRPRAVLTMRFGLDGGGPRSAAEVGRAWDLGKDAIYRIEKAALADLRERLESPRRARTEGHPAMYIVRLTAPDGDISYVPGACLMQPESGGGPRRAFPTDPVFARKFSLALDAHAYVADHRATLESHGYRAEVAEYREGRSVGPTGMGGGHAGVLSMNRTNGDAS